MQSSLCASCAGFVGPCADMMKGPAATGHRALHPALRASPAYGLQRAETHLADRRLAELHVRETVRRDQDLAALLVLEAQQLRLPGQRLGHHALDLLRVLTALQNDL